MLSRSVLRGYRSYRRSILVTSKINNFENNVRFKSNSNNNDDDASSRLGLDLSELDLGRIRNFSVVAHVDHGKSTLADRILEHAGAVDRSKDNKQILDRLEVERERGITVKAQTASITHTFDGQKYLLNLMDTPGHVDFSAEVSRSLLASQGVVLLVCAKDGVQAQTVSNFYLAFAADLAIVPALNKVDLPGADPDKVKEQLRNAFEIDPGEVLLASAKTGQGVEEILDAIVKRIPPPNPDVYGKKEDNLRLLLQDSWYDQYRGAVLLVQIMSGTLRTGDVVTSVLTGKNYPVRTLSVLAPDEAAAEALYPGQVGCFTCNLRDSNDAVVGDTFHLKDKPVAPVISDIVQPKPMVYAGFYPFDSSKVAQMKSAIEKVSLNDAAVSVAAESSGAFGHGWRLGFLGVLHMEVFSQRLETEYGASVIVTTPSVPYKIAINEHNVAKKGKEVLVTNPNDWLDTTYADKYLEPMVRATIVAPSSILSDILSLCNERRGIQGSIEYVDQERIKVEYLMPLAEVVVDLFPELKRLSSGYASFDYEEAGYQAAKLLRLEVLLNGKAVPEMTTICHGSRARARAREIVSRLKETLPRQQFAVAIQVASGKKVLARDDLKALRKDVTAKCYGGDVTRKMKLLKNQAEGKKKMRSLGNIEISKDTFVKIMTKT